MFLKMVANYVSSKIVKTMRIINSANLFGNSIKKPLLPKADINNPRPETANRQKNAGAESKKHDGAVKNPTSVSVETAIRQLKRDELKKPNAVIEDPIKLSVETTTGQQKPGADLKKQTSSVDNRDVFLTRLLNDSRPKKYNAKKTVAKEPNDTLYKIKNFEKKLFVDTTPKPRRSSIENPLYPETETFPMRRRSGSIENPLVPEIKHKTAVGERKEEAETVARPPPVRKGKIVLKRRPASPAPSAFDIPPYRGRGSGHGLRSPRSSPRRSPLRPNANIPETDSPRRTFPKYTSRYPSPSNAGTRVTKKQTPKRPPTATATKSDKRKQLSDSEMNSVNSGGAEK